MQSQILTEKARGHLETINQSLAITYTDKELLNDLIGGINHEKKLQNLWLCALKYGELQNNTGDAAERLIYKRLIDYIREAMGEMARISQKPTVVEFGTSGWRGRIGDEFTIYNVHKVARAIIDTMRSGVFLQFNGYKSFAEVQNKGIVVFRDNRYMGDEFIEAALGELHAAGIKTYLAGECPTGVGSAVVTELGAAGSFNFTPSHNPMDAAGLKFNPADGGPADQGVTNIIQVRANEYMQDRTFAPHKNDRRARSIAPVEIYLRFLDKSRIIDLPELKNRLLEQSANLAIVVDNMHGASRGVIEKILGEELIQKLDIQFVHTETDYAFHGVKPEPSAANQMPLIAMLRRSDKPLRLGVALDPDADRIRFADANLDLDMNMFAAIALDYARRRGLPQGVVTSVASSGFAASIARQHSLPAAATAVGFKNFRKYLTAGAAAVAFEESDGLSFIGHTLEKDGIIGFLTALAAMLEQNANLAQIFADLQKKYGYYYPGKDGRTITGVTIGEWQEFRSRVLSSIRGGYQAGDKIFIGAEAKHIQQILLEDGVKFIFTDDSWILLRPSGTETKFRYYYETTGKGNDVLLPDYKAAAENILQKAIEAERI
jgi:phosphomannomutase